MGLSLLLSVYRLDKPDYLNQALLSVWDEQILKPDQIVLVKDGPLVDSLDEVIACWSARLGSTLKVVALAENIGLGLALNEGLKHCQGELIARMDSDDISLPERFEQQVEFMEMNPDIAASSAILEEWDVDMTRCLGVRTLPTSPLAVERFAKRRSPLSHPLVIFRRSAVDTVGGYPNLRKAQDYGLWSILLVNGYKLANLPTVLLKMRAGNEMFCRRGWQYFKEEYHLLKFQKEIRFLSASDYYINVMLKAVLRSSPNLVKSFAYRFAR